MISFFVKNLFFLSNGYTVFACIGSEVYDCILKNEATIFVSGKERQKISGVGKRLMINRKKNDDQFALEFKGRVDVTLEEIKMGEVKIIFD